MRVLEGESKGDLRVSEPVDVRGVVSGAVTVAGGGVLSLGGLCGGELTVEPGGTASVHGVVAGEAVNRGGVLNVHGLVAGPLRAEKGQTYLAPGSKILGGLQGSVVVGCVGCGQRLNVPTDRGELTLNCPTCAASWAWSPGQYGASAGDVHVHSGGAGQPPPAGSATPPQPDQLVKLLGRIYATLVVIAALLGAVLGKLLTM